MCYSLKIFCNQRFALKTFTFVNPCVRPHTYVSPELESWVKSVIYSGSPWKNPKALKVSPTLSLQLTACVTRNVPSVWHTT